MKNFEVSAGSRFAGLWQASDSRTSSDLCLSRLPAFFKLLKNSTKVDVRDLTVQDKLGLF
jgi:hypothetical protein